MPKWKCERCYEDKDSCVLTTKQDSIVEPDVCPWGLDPEWKELERAVNDG